MFKKLTVFILTMILVSYSAVTFSKEPENLVIIKHNLMYYHDSGAYEKDIASVVDQAMEYLKIRLAKEKNSSSPKKLAIVLDIDETALSNYPDMLKLDFGGSLAEIDSAGGKGSDPVLKPTLNLYRFAKENKVAVFFVTGRIENYREGTTKNLEAVGYKNWDGLYLKPTNYNKKTASIYKATVREQIEQKGYDIVLNIGDQQSDLVGGHADKTLKLPNPYYLVP